VPFYSALLQHFHLAEVLRPASLSQLPICNFYKFHQTAALPATRVTQTLPPRPLTAVGRRCGLTCACTPSACCFLGRENDNRLGVNFVCCGFFDEFSFCLILRQTVLYLIQTQAGQLRTPLSENVQRVETRNIASVTRTVPAEDQVMGF
jgi:hypothetical protein